MWYIQMQTDKTLTEIQIQKIKNKKRSQAYCLFVLFLFLSHNDQVASFTGNKIPSYRNLLIQTRFFLSGETMGNKSEATS